jgi:hypothetical protein
MKIYIAHNFDARIWLRQEIIPVLSRHTITSSWILSDECFNVSLEQNAINDFNDLTKADIFVLFTNQFGKRHGRGKFVELGMAIARVKVICLIGDKDTSCVFYNYTGICWFANIYEFKNWLEGGRR